MGHYGKLVLPMRKRSHSRAAPRPSLKAHTTRLWPRRQSPAAKTPLTLVEYFSNSALMLDGARLLGAGDFLGHKVALFVALPLDLNGQDFLDPAMLVAGELFSGGEID